MPVGDDVEQLICVREVRSHDEYPHVHELVQAERKCGARVSRCRRLPYAGEIEFEECVENAVESLPDDLSAAMSNVELVVEDEPPRGLPLLGLYQGIPLTKRGSSYAGALPDKITIYRGPLERLYGADAERLQREIRRVVLHEIAHHFGISDERLRELDRY